MFILADKLAKVQSQLDRINKTPNQAEIYREGSQTLRQRLRGRHTIFYLCISPYIYIQTFRGLVSVSKLYARMVAFFHLDG